MLQIFAHAFAAATLERDPPSPQPRAALEAADAAWLEAIRRRKARREPLRRNPAEPSPEPALRRATPPRIRLDMGA